MKTLLIRLAFFLMLIGPAAAQTTPQTGWWLSTTEGGRGYAIEVRNNKVFMAALMYNSSGVPIWYLGQGPLIGSSVLSDLEFYGSGTNLLFATPSTATRLGSTATQMTFGSATFGTIQFLDVSRNNTSSLTRYEFAAGGLTSGAAAGLPESGWWWAPSEPGTGYFMEFQRSSYYLAVMHYANPVFGEDGAVPGQAIWDVAVGAMTTPTLLQGTLTRYQNGQSLGGTYRAPTLNHTLGTVSLSFGSTTRATLSLSTGKTLALERFRF